MSYMHCAKTSGKTGEWPEDQSRFSSHCRKKGNLRECENYRKLQNNRFSSKILLRVIVNRIQAKAEAELSDEQAGFRPGRGTRDHITNIRIIMEKARSHGQPLCSVLSTFKKPSIALDMRNLGGPFWIWVSHPIWFNCCHPSTGIRKLLYD